MVKTWNIWDFPDNLYILLKEDIHKEFFNQMFKKFGGKRPYARFLGISQMGMKQYWRRYTKKNGKTYIQYIPLWVIKKSCNTNELKRKIENGLEKIRVRTGNPIFNFKLPLKESPELYRILAHLIGDGSVGETHTPYYSNTCKKLRQQFKKDLHIFGTVKTNENIPNTTPVLTFPKVIAEILKYIFNINFTKSTKLPKQIYKTTGEYKCAFLQALYDDEGTTSNSTTIGMNNLNLIKEIKNLVESLNIKTNKIIFGKSGFGKGCYYFSISEEYIQEFKEKIGFLHPKKLKRLNFKLKIKERNKIQRTRSLKWTRNKIINLIKDKPITTIELSNKLLLSFGGLYHHLIFLEDCGKIKRKGYKNKIIWSLSQGRSQLIE